MAYILGIDAGGTFIDYFLVDEHGKHIAYKALTDNSPDYGIIQGLFGLTSLLNTNLEDFIKNTTYIIHGTTVTTNAVLTRSGAKTALLTTEGLIDLLEMRQGVREDIYNNFIEPPSPLINRWLRIPIKERVDYQGKVIKKLDINHTLKDISHLRDNNIESIAIVLAHSYINPGHEYKLSEMVEDLFPDVHISLSCEVYPKPHMYKRLTTTVLNAYVAPVLENYLTKFNHRLNDLGFTGELLIMQANGGTISVEESLHNPVMSILSGPAAGPISLDYVLKDYGKKNFIIMDMGGTSFDISMVQNGSPTMRENATIDGHMLCLPIIDIHTLGSGGGSIAWVDNGKMLHVGPASAGANPGPACYDNGGDNPTVTDANLLLGYINPDYFLAGRLKLNYQNAWKAIENHVAKPLNIDTISAAIGIYQLVNTDMVAGIKEVTSEKGFDPRKMSLVVGGGAGPIHAGYLANQLDITTIIIPKDSSVMCALGMLNSGYRRSLFQYYYGNLNNIKVTNIEQIFIDLWEKAKNEALFVDEINIEKKQIYMRYNGQHSDLLIDIDVNCKLSKLYIQETFHQHHLTVYGYNLKELDTEIEIVGLSITVQGAKWISPYKNEQNCKRRHILKSSRWVYFEELADFIEVPVYDGDNTYYGYKILGPALIEQRHSTIVVPSKFSVTYELDNFIMRKI